MIEEDKLLGRLKTATEVLIEKKRFEYAVHRAFDEFVTVKENGERLMDRWEFYCAVCNLMERDP
jgi:hypothetical protein